MHNYQIVLKFIITAESQNEAEYFGIDCYKHLIETFNDNEALSQYYVVNAERAN